MNNIAQIPSWNKIAYMVVSPENGKSLRLAFKVRSPSARKAMSAMQSAVKVRETSCGGRFSGWRKICVMVGRTW